MKKLRLLPLLLLLLSPWTPISGNPRKDDKGPTPDQIIQRFSAKESEFQREWQNYTYTQKVIFEVLNDAGIAVEQQRMTIEVLFDTSGKRSTRIVEEQGRLRSVQVTEQDMHDIVELQPFVLTEEELPKYEIRYKGEEWVDEINTFVFDVKPKKVRKSDRAFEGRIWVDDLDFQIVRTKGKIVPDLGDNKFPEFETIRQQVDGEFWFPVWIKGDDRLTFGGFWDRRTVHVRQWVTFENFQRFDVGTTIRFGEVQPDPEQPRN
jgi:hypothetical protein